LAVGGGVKDSAATVDIRVWLSRSSQATFVPEQRLFLRKRLFHRSVGQQQVSVSRRGDARICA
jgi:hypothetical protein